MRTPRGRHGGTNSQIQRGDVLECIHGGILRASLFVRSAPGSFRISARLSRYPKIKNFSSDSLDEMQEYPPALRSKALLGALLFSFLLSYGFANDLSSSTITISIIEEEASYKCTYSFNR